MLLPHAVNRIPRTFGSVFALSLGMFHYKCCLPLSPVLFPLLCPRSVPNTLICLAESSSARGHPLPPLSKGRAAMPSSGERGNTPNSTLGMAPGNTELPQLLEPRDSVSDSVMCGSEFHRFTKQSWMLIPNSKFSSRQAQASCLSPVAADG